MAGRTQVKNKPAVQAQNIVEPQPWDSSENKNGKECVAETEEYLCHCDQHGKHKRKGSGKNEVVQICYAMVFITYLQYLFSVFYIYLSLTT